MTVFEILEKLERLDGYIGDLEYGRDLPEYSKGQVAELLREYRDLLGNLKTVGGPK